MKIKYDTLSGEYKTLLVEKNSGEGAIFVWLFLI